MGRIPIFLLCYFSPYQEHFNGIVVDYAGTVNNYHIANSLCVFSAGIVLILIGITIVAIMTYPVAIPALKVVRGTLVGWIR